MMAACLARTVEPASRVISASRVIAAHHTVIFEYIADPARQPLWDGNDNLAAAPGGQRVRQVGDVFTMTLTLGSTRVNRVVELVEGRVIAWRPSEPDRDPPGHLWRWELDPAEGGSTLVTHTYDWTQLADPARVERARWTTSDRLRASLQRLDTLVNKHPAGTSEARHENP